MNRHKARVQSVSNPPTLQNYVHKWTPKGKKTKFANKETNTCKKAREITARCVISRIMSDNASASGARPCADPLCGGIHEQIIFNLVKVYF